ncbi:MAG: hypothetical protein AAGB97_03655 [Dehalococcoidia bacterium]|nr:hypothetical protein [Chloroflexota bacterium]MBT9162510.1 hypothetical protein [Chloroflexota bacterium]
MISMLYFELKLLRKRKILFIVMLLLPIYFVPISLLIPPDEDLFIVQLIPLIVGWLLSGGNVTSMKRYRQFESLFSLSVAPKHIFGSSLLAQGIYYVYVFLIFLPLYLPGVSIGSLTELRAVFLIACLLMALKGLANYIALLIRRIYLISWATMLIYMLAFFSLGHIQRIVEYPYAWMVLPISLVAIAITYMMTTRLSKERVILSSE